MLTVLGFGRSVLLARLLPIEVFGIYAFAGSILSITSPLATWATGNAFLHRSSETQDEGYAAAVLLTLKLILMPIWAFLVITGALIFTSGQNRLALVVLTIVSGLSQLTEVPRLILTRRIVHRRLAIMQLLDAVISTFVTLFLAWQGVTLWALLASNFVTLVLNVSALYIWRPVWKPYLAWSTPVMHYYLSFGSKSLVATLIAKALDQLDDFWTGVFLSNTSLSFYSKAYNFATYPRKIVANPINSVAAGIYAELKGDRLRLSQAFFRVNAFLVRSGFLLAGLLALIAPEFIRILLGERWMPMLNVFRLMLIFTLFDPIKATVGDLFIAVGKPEMVVRARMIQLGIMVAGLFAFGLWLDIAGVALAVDVMLVVGIALLLWQARDYVDFSISGLLGPPFLALAIAVAAATITSNLPAVHGSDWLTGIIKLSVFTICYSLIIFILERKKLMEITSYMLSTFSRKQRKERK